MLNNFKWLIAVVLVVGFALVAFGDFAKAGGVPSDPNDCVNYCKEVCYITWHDECVEDCYPGPHKKVGQCIAECNILTACEFNYCLWASCGLGSETLAPPLCE